MQQSRIADVGAWLESTRYFISLPQEIIRTNVASNRKQVLPMPEPALVVKSVNPDSDLAKGADGRPGLCAGADSFSHAPS
eukprot:4933011-Amphidinium_carterae.1